MKKFLSLLIVSIMITAGCSNEKKKEPVVEKPVDVNILLPTSDINLNKEITIRAEVSQNNKAVSDADEVQFEIGKNGEDSIAMLDAKNGADGIYSATYKFTDPGDYYVIAHVTARDQHSMPKKDFKVQTTTSTSKSNGEKSEHETHSGDDHHGDVMIHLMGTENIAANKENLFTIHLMKNDGKPLEKANVRIETWKDEHGKHDYTDAKEVAPGEYEVKYTFKEKGTNTVKVHVEKDALHDHTEKEVTVN
ncbi:FixH family protein [Gottfriedia acidiceleris]|uniref:FixH family protein n=1 Tax=Gottfriedia acidiceleris TaxID=371036 RepID=UPI000B44E2D1|nr:FixH family protein [Gottfriedia acidiceleris]